MTAKTPGIDINPHATHQHLHVPLPQTTNDKSATDQPILHCTLGRSGLCVLTTAFPPKPLLSQNTFLSRVPWEKTPPFHSMQIGNQKLYFAQSYKGGSTQNSYRATTDPFAQQQQSIHTRDRERTAYGTQTPSSPHSTLPRPRRSHRDTYNPFLFSNIASTAAQRLLTLTNPHCFLNTSCHHPASIHPLPLTRYPASTKQCLLFPSLHHRF